MSYANFPTQTVKRAIELTQAAYEEKNEKRREQMIQDVLDCRKTFSGWLRLSASFGMHAKTREEAIKKLRAKRWRHFPGEFEILEISAKSPVMVDLRALVEAALANGVDTVAVSSEDARLLLPHLKQAHIQN